MLGNPSKQNLSSSGNETFDRFLGGGFLDSSLNLFERQGPSSRLLDSILNKTFCASTLARKDALIYVNLNTTIAIEATQLLASLPTPRKVKSDLLYKDVRNKSATAQIKIAWRYSSRGTSSPSDGMARTDQIDFGFSLPSEMKDLGTLRILNINQDSAIDTLLQQLLIEIADLSSSHARVNILFRDILHPFSLLINNDKQLLSFFYMARCLSRMLKGSILVCFDTDMCINHSDIKLQLYNLADSVVSFYSYETGENKITGYRDIDGTLSYLKVPKINSFGFHFQQGLADWGYRLTKNHRFFVIDELSLPPCDDDEADKSIRTSKLTNFDNVNRPLEQVGPLEEFREVAKDVISRQL